MKPILLLLTTITLLLSQEEPTWTIAPDGTYIQGDQIEILPDGSFTETESEDIKEEEYVEYVPQSN